MKTQKLFVFATIVCLLVGATSAAMARNDCPRDGSINGGTFDEIVINEFESCSIVGVTVNGDIRIRNADEITIKGSLIKGQLRVIDTKSAFLLYNTVQGGNNLVTRGNTSATVVANLVTGGGSLRVTDAPCNQNLTALVELNRVYNGNLTVNCMEKATVKENNVNGGNITCSENDRLDSQDNDAFGGRVNCSESLFD